MPYKLKGETFEIMGGPDEGKKFKRGRVYESVPDGYADRFMECGGEPPHSDAEFGIRKAEGANPVTKKKAGLPGGIPPWDADETDKKGE